MGYRVLGTKMIAPTLHIIYDDRRFERFEPLMRELSRQGITDYKIWSPVYDSESTIRSISKSHKQIVAYAKCLNLPKIAIAEDDLFIPAKDGWRKFLEQEPVWPYDIYLGGTYGLQKPVTGKIEKINGLQLYIVSERFYDTFLDLPETTHIDVAMDRLGLYYVCYPLIALQRPAWSANSREFSDKNVTLTKEDIYYG
jgi:hypothetical protein